MHSRATHLIRLLIAAAIVSVAAPIAQGGNRNHRLSAQVPDPVRAAYTAAWQAYRGLPGGPPARTAPDPVRAAYTAAWQAYRGLPGGPPVSTRSVYPPLETGQGFSFAAPAGRTQPTPLAANGPGGFDWGDAGIGAAGMLGIVLLVGGVGAALIAARNHRRQPRNA